MTIEAAPETMWFEAFRTLVSVERVRIVGGADNFWPDVETTRWAAEQIPYEDLQGVGHYPMEEIKGFPALLVQRLRELSLEAEVETRWAASK